MKPRIVILLASILIAITATTAVADTLYMSDARRLARKIGRRLAAAYQAETWKLVGCYKTGRATGRCSMRFYAIQGTGQNCAYAISVWAANGSVYSRYYADDCPAP